MKLIYNCPVILISVLINVWTFFIFDDTYFAIVCVALNSQFRVLNAGKH